MGHPRTLICIMDLFVSCLNKFPANFQKKSGWKIQLSNFPTDPAVLCRFFKVISLGGFLP